MYLDDIVKPLKKSMLDLTTMVLFGRRCLCTVYFWTHGFEWAAFSTSSAFVAGCWVHVWEASVSVPVAPVVCVLLSVPSVGF